MAGENKENQVVEEVKNPYNLVDNDNETTSTTSNNSITNNIQEKAGGFLENVVRKIAKMAGLPDPKTGEPAKASTTTTSNTTNKVDTNTSLEQDVATQEAEKKQEEEKKKFSFENVMSGVTGVLDKIGKKVEEKAKSIDLDKLIKKNDENTNNSTEKTETTQDNQDSDTGNESKENDEPTDNKVEKNNEEYLSENH